MLKTVVFSNFDVLGMFSPNETGGSCTHTHTDAVTVKAVHLNVGEGGLTVRFHYEVSPLWVLKKTNSDPLHWLKKMIKDFK